MKEFTKFTKEVHALSNKKKARTMQGFFKTGKGEYGEGDIFLGLTTPEQRNISKFYNSLTFPELTRLLYSRIHEYRAIALFILIEQYNTGNDKDKLKIFNFYIKHILRVNNWDLVDGSAPYIMGEYLLKKPRKILYEYAQSKNLWKRRVAIISTFTFIKHNDFKDTIKIATLLLYDDHDLIHKAVGWMLREVGKKDLKYEERFLKKYYTIMPRTTLRYAIERFPEHTRTRYMKK